MGLLPLTFAKPLATIDMPFGLLVFGSSTEMVLEQSPALQMLFISQGKCNRPILY